MRHYLVIVFLFLLAMNVFAGEETAYNCEVYVDKAVPVKVFFHDSNTTYSKMELYLKVREDLAAQVVQAKFYAREKIYHAYGQSYGYWKAYPLERVVQDYFKISLELRADNHSVGKYSNRRDWEGNFYFDLADQSRLWTNIPGNIALTEASMGRVPVNTLWLNDGDYNLDFIPQTNSYEQRHLWQLNRDRCPRN